MRIAAALLMGLVGAFLVVVVVIAIQLHSFGPSYSYRYRLVLHLQTADGDTRSDSSVIEVTWPPGARITGGLYGVQLRGRAVIVDFGNRKALVAPLSRFGVADDGAVSLDFLAARAFGNGRSATDDLPSLPKLKGKRQLASDNMPQLVWISDVSDPTSIRKVSPAELPGIAGAKLVGMMVEITQDPVADGVDPRFPWVNSFPSSITSMPNEFRLSRHSFISG